MKNFWSKSGFWFLVFLALFLLTQDYLFASWTPKPALLGLPNWLYWFVAIHVIFILTFYFFTKKYWK